MLQQLGGFGDDADGEVLGAVKLVPVPGFAEGLDHCGQVFDRIGHGCPRHNPLSKREKFSMRYTHEQVLRTLRQRTGKVKIEMGKKRKLPEKTELTVGVSGAVLLESGRERAKQSLTKLNTKH